MNGIKTEREVKEHMHNMIDRVDAFLEDSDEDTILGRVLLLETKAWQGDIDALLEGSIIALYLEDLV